MIPTVYGLHLITKDQYTKFNDDQCYFTIQDVMAYPNPLACYETQGEIEKQILHLNIYDFYRDVYDTDTRLEKLGEANRLGEAIINGEKHTYKRGHTVNEYTPWLQSPAHHNILLGEYLSDYVNREDVREALHIRDDVGAWSDCANIDYTALAQGSIWIYEELRGKYKVMVYSGDTDGAVATYGTKVWIDSLGWGINEKWRNWFTDDQVSGMVTKYDGLDFVTVHGVGHMCPQWKRKDVTKMILNWIHDEDF